MARSSQRKLRETTQGRNRVNFLGKEIGKNKYPFIVAEISCNHQGNLLQAKELIHGAKEAGADAVKIQVYTADEMTLNVPLEEFYIKKGLWRGRELYSLYASTQTDYNLADDIINYCREINIPWFASVFGKDGLSFLESKGCPAYKIASFELPDIGLIKEVAKTKKPIVLSTGMASYDEIGRAWSITTGDCILLHCVSAYPTPLEEINLWRISKLQEQWGEPVGFSDHTTGHLAAQIACGMGACMIEKHLYTGAPGAEDAEFSLTPTAFKFFVQACRRAAEASFEATSLDEENNKQFRRSLYVVKDVPKGKSFDTNDIRSIRPSYGLPPSELDMVLTKKAKYNLLKGEALKMEHLE